MKILCSNPQEPLSWGSVSLCIFLVRLTLIVCRIKRLNKVQDFFMSNHLIISINIAYNIPSLQIQEKPALYKYSTQNSLLLLSLSDFSLVALDVVHFQSHVRSMCASLTTWITKCTFSVSSFQFSIANYIRQFHWLIC